MKIRRRFAVFLAWTILTVCSGFAGMTEEKWVKIVDLEGNWKFTIGDNKKWADPNYPDSDWETIEVPSEWEEEGFYGYDGYAWYRTSFNGTELKNKYGTFNLFLGYIDDVDEVYFNGHKIGASGSFPPKYHTAYNALRNYFIPNEYINFAARNVIAVRVFDSEIAGGIVSGDIGIYSNKDDAALTINLRGSWDFVILEKDWQKNNFKSVRPAYDLKDSKVKTAPIKTDEKKSLPDNDGRMPPADAKWTKITVPSPWEHQGYPDHDGAAWYRKQFIVPKSLEGEDLVLILGKIDDYDESYLNGKLIGTTNQHDKLRMYHVTSEMVKTGALNLLLIYVDDPQGLGGIWEGPVGIMKQSSFTKYMRWKED